MFGYINTNPEELSDEAKKTYRAYYCGLCRSLKQHCGTKGQMLLAYDMTFLIVLLTGLYELPNQEESFTCAIHPGRKRTAYLNDATAYAADMNLILGYHKLLDNWRDDGSTSGKRLADSLEKEYEAAISRHPRQATAVTEYLTRIAQAEREKEENIDVAAGATGEILAEIFAWREDEWREELRCMGFYLGKYIYFMDAYEDMERDRKKGSYNPLIKLSKEKSQDEYETICRCMMTCQVGECAKSFERLPVLQHAEIIRNILYSGIWSKYEILQKKRKKRK